MFVSPERTGKLDDRARGRVVAATLDERYVALRQTGTRCQAGLGQTRREAQATEGALPFANEAAQITPCGSERLGHLRKLLELRCERVHGRP